MAQPIAAAHLTVTSIGRQVQKTGTRKTFQRISGWEQRRKGFIRIVATADGSEESEVKENVNKAATLKQLDQQLATLADRDDSPASRQSLDPSQQQVRPTKRQPGEQSKDGAVEWPEFSAGFLGFMGFALLLLTVINNLLYKTFLGPPVVPFRSGDPVLSSADQEPRYRITSASEEREAKAKAAAEITPDSPAITSRVAPALNSE